MGACKLRIDLCHARPTSFARRRMELKNTSSLVVHSIQPYEPNQKSAHLARDLSGDEHYKTNIQIF